ncbi:ferric reductase-like protein transmembrane component 4 [Aulographum hederae CBS 113979]|uniref:Ferric reductase-like protein transmembrane component 4 n=1 Tax=Aulographum hederae CBS 113979 TaxID=1176131 RepID=A0A6G1H596_9PEZI|nr:ferric reductase-like protein transmembrane component 4 [Aulographum hederae CBS 113979]
MAAKLSLLAAVSLHVLHATCMVSQGRKGHGLIGYGIEMYKPTCAFACRDTISGSSLSCTPHSMDDMEGMDGMAMDMGGDTEPECYATDDVFLQTLAYCISTHCQGVPLWELEEYWKKNVAGNDAVQPDPKISYQKALEDITETPTAVLVSGEPLNVTSVVGEEDYMLNWRADSIFEDMEVTHERYGLVLLLSGVIIPIGFSLLRFFPWPAQLATKFNAYFIYPPAFGSKHKQSLMGIAHMPTRGQAFFVFYIVAINVILSAVGFRSKQPSSWYETTSQEIFTFVANRAGVLSFANVPLLILYAGRNNFLLWVTNWSHGTFLLLHRWVAWLCTLQAVLHSAIYLDQYVKMGEHASEAKLPYWIWGAVATLGMSILLLTSVQPIRRAVYEAFLLWHIVLSVFIVVGCYLHIIYRFQNQWGYEVWMFVAFAVWGFDRLMRLAKLARNGIRTAKVTVLDDDYIRVDIPGVSGNGHAYLYFPTLTWRVWENHPFSVASTVLASPSPASNPTHTPADIEKSAATTTTASSTADSSSDHSGRKLLPSTTPGLTFLLRTRSGLTSFLRAHATLPVLVESPYAANECDTTSSTLLIAIAGGVGITAVLPLLRAHPGRSKLFWGARSEGIVKDMRASLEGIGNLEVETFVGGRMDCTEAVRREKVTVAVSGPEGMADEVRRAVCEVGKQGGVSVEFVEEAFSW